MPRRKRREFFNFNEEEKEEPVKSTKKPSDECNIRAFLSNSVYVRSFNPYLKTGFEKWMRIHHPYKVIKKLSINEWEKLFKAYANYIV